MDRRTFFSAVRNQMVRALKALAAAMSSVKSSPMCTHDGPHDETPGDTIFSDHRHVRRDMGMCTHENLLRVP